MADDTAAGSAAWHKVVTEKLKEHDVQLVTYVPDNVLRPLIDAVHADDYFHAFATAREEEAAGILGRRDEEVTITAKALLLQHRRGLPRRLHREQPRRRRRHRKGKDAGF